MSSDASRDKIIYVGDPMCSWCYGISQAFSDFKRHYAETKDFELVMGGLRPYNKETMKDLQSFLTHHWEAVHRASGQIFNYDILDRTDITYDTEPPSRAVVAVRMIDPDKAFLFFQQVQKAFYIDNKNLHLSDSYHPILDLLAIDRKQFTSLFESDDLKKSIKSDFIRAAFKLQMQLC